MSKVELKMSEGRVDIWVGHDAGVRWPCPECGTGGTPQAMTDQAGRVVWSATGALPAQGACRSASARGGRGHVNSTLLLPAPFPEHKHDGEARG